MNRVILVGRLAKDWERDDNSRFIKNTLAVNGKETMFAPIISFNEKTMDAIENYTAKGSMIAVDGTLSIKSKKQDDGTYKTFVSIIANSIEFMNTKQEPEQKEVINDFDRKDPVEKAKEILGDDALWD